MENYINPPDSTLNIFIIWKWGGGENDIKNPNPMIQPCHRPSIFYDTLTTTTI